MKKDKILKSNMLIRKTGNIYSEIEQKLLNYIISQLESKSNSLELEVKVKDVLGALRMSDAGKNYKTIKVALFELAKKELKWLECNCQNSIVFLEKVDVLNKGKFKVKISEMLREHLCDLQQKGDYTTMGFETIKKLKGKHVIALYEFFKSYENMKNKEGNEHYSLTFKVETIKDKLSVSSSPTYSRLVDFERKLLHKAIEQINYKTEITVRIKRKFSEKGSTYFVINVYRTALNKVKHLQDDLHSELEITLEDFQRTGTYDQNIRRTKEKMTLLSEQIEIMKVHMKEAKEERSRLTKMMRRIDERTKEKELHHYEMLIHRKRVLRQMKKMDRKIKELQKDIPF